MNRELDRKIIQARKQNDVRDFIVNAVEFTVAVFIFVTGLFFGWLTLGLMFR